MRVMNGSISEVGFVDPHDPTGGRQTLHSPSIVTFRQLSMPPSPRIRFQSELSHIQIVLRAKTLSFRT
jgi:hypothetical protein